MLRTAHGPYIDAFVQPCLCLFEGPLLVTCSWYREEVSMLLQVMPPLGEGRLVQLLQEPSGTIKVMMLTSTRHAAAGGACLERSWQGWSCERLGRRLGRPASRADGPDPGAARRCAAFQVPAGCLAVKYLAVLPSAFTRIRFALPHKEGRRLSPWPWRPRRVEDSALPASLGPFDISYSSPLSVAPSVWVC